MNTGVTDRDGKLIEFTIVSPDGTIFILNALYDLVAVSPGGWERWRNRLDGPPLTAPAVDAHGILYLINQQNKLISIDRLGNASVLQELKSDYSDIYVFSEYVLLRNSKGFDIYTIGGDYHGSVTLMTDKVVIGEKSLHCLDSRGNWFLLNPREISIEEGGCPPTSRPNISSG